MNLERYPIFRLGRFTFQFFSTGKIGRYEQRIEFEAISATMYNVAFGIFDPVSYTIDDTRFLRNGDSDKILATVATAILTFLEENPKVNVAATGYVRPGKLAVRTRKYQMDINKNFELLSPIYNVYGFVAERDENGQIIGTWPKWPGQWEAFSPVKQYDAFLINKR